MKLPELNQIKKTTDDISEFGGYNHNLVIGGNEFYDDLNMSADHYPVLTQRKKRHAKEIEVVAIEDRYSNITLCSNDSLAYLIGSTLHYGDEVIDEFGYANQHNILLSMGDKICSFPIGKVYDTKNKTVDYIRSDHVADFSWAHKANFLYTNSERSFQYKPTGDKNTGKQFDVTVNIPLAEFANQSGTESFATYMTNANNSISALINPKNATMVKSNNFSLVSIKYVKRNGDYITLKIRLKAKKKLYKNKKYTFKITKILINADNTLNTNNYVNMCIVNDQGNPITYTTSATAPASPTDGMYWLDISKTPNLIKMYSASKSNWEEVKSSTYRFSYSKKFSTDFQVGDTVTVTSSDLKDGYAQQFEISNIATDGSWFEVKTMFEFAALVITKDFKIQRSLPYFEYACECNNRIFGVSNSTNEIYACKLGDPMNWNTFMGLADDSYSLKFGTEGPFTGIFNYMGTILIFKENYIHRLYGTKPSNFSLNTIECEGIADGAWDSCALVDGTLFFKGKHGIYAYSGNMPSKISDNLGMEEYEGGRAGAYDGKYYIFFDDVGFSFDTRKGIWHKESAADVESNIEEHLSNLYYIKKELISATESYESVLDNESKASEGYIVDYEINGLKGDQFMINNYYHSTYSNNDNICKVSFVDCTMSDIIITDYSSRYIYFTLTENCKTIRLTFYSDDPNVYTVDPGTYISSTNKLYVNSNIQVTYYIYEDSSGVKHIVDHPQDSTQVLSGYKFKCAYYNSAYGQSGASNYYESYIYPEDLDANDVMSIRRPSGSGSYDPTEYKYNSSTKKLDSVGDKLVVELNKSRSIDISVKKSERYKYLLSSLDHFDGCTIEESNLNWYAETGNIGFSSITNKWISKIVVRAEVAQGATFKIYAKYDEGSWEEIYKVETAKSLNTLVIPIISRRCDHLKYKFSGTGDVKIYSITKFVEQGSELHYGTH